MSGVARGRESNPSEAPRQTRPGTDNTNPQPATTNLTATQERAVRLALDTGRWRRRAKHAEATIARVQALHDRWQATHNPAAHELNEALAREELP